MRSSSPTNPKAKPGLHPRNRHAAGYDFPRLVGACPELGKHVRPSPAGTPTIDFAAPAAVLALNRALLKADYGIAHWDLPPGYLCPPIPGRADYLHHLADLLGENARGPTVRVFDVGVGANAIYPILGHQEYGWSFVGSEIDPVALKAARANVAANPGLAGHIECRPQGSPAQLFRGVVRAWERFAACLCNPPFHGSAAEAAAGTQRKVKNLHGQRAAEPVLNFGGQSHELWCPGGEVGFIRRLIAESAELPELCRWFTTLVSKRDSLPLLERALKSVRPHDVRIIPMQQGQKQSRILAWTFARADLQADRRPA